jgi:crossover junction endodeoxyribonuclease RusA
MTPQTQTPPEGSVLIELPWPDSKLAGHHNVHWRVLQPVKAKHKTWAKFATLAADITVPETGDIRVSATFYPPNKRGDRVNYPILAKPYWDGIAEALGVNDRRFLPSYHFAEPVSNPRVVVRIG